MLGGSARDPEMTLPNFLVIGAMKAGTTSLYKYLGQHPEIFLSPIKEPGFFAFEGERPEVYRHFRHEPFVTTIEAYKDLFRGVTDEQAVGEMSTQYLDFPQSAARIRHYIPSARLIAVLRHPVDRAFSYYVMRLRGGQESVADFSQAIRREKACLEKGIKVKSPYISKVSYYDSLRVFFDTFDKRQMKIMLYDDLYQNPQEFIRNIFGFLNVDDNFLPDLSARHNTGGVQRNSAIGALLNKPNPIRAAARLILPRAIRERYREKILAHNLMPPPSLDPQLRSELMLHFRPEIKKLQDLISRDLSHWIE